MAFPPPTLPVTRANATPQLNTHPADHNAANLAINDIVTTMNTRWRMAWASAGIQTANAGVYDQVVYSGAKQDPYGWITGGDIKPDRAGYYLVVAYHDWTGTTAANATAIEIRRDTTLYGRQAQTGIANQDVTASAFVYANGSTHIISVWGYHNNAANQQQDGNVGVFYVGM